MKSIKLTFRSLSGILYICECHEDREQELLYRHIIENKSYFVEREVLEEGAKLTVASRVKLARMKELIDDVLLGSPLAHDGTGLFLREPDTPRHTDSVVQFLGVLADNRTIAGSSSIVTLQRWEHKLKQVNAILDSLLVEEN